MRAGSRSGSADLLPILLFNFVFTLTVTGVSIGGHVGGVASGFITGWLVTEYGEKRNQQTLALLGCLRGGARQRLRRRSRSPAGRGCCRTAGVSERPLTPALSGPLTRRP